MANPRIGRTLWGSSQFGWDARKFYQWIYEFLFMADGSTETPSIICLEDMVIGDSVRTKLTGSIVCGGLQAATGPNINIDDVVRIQDSVEIHLDGQRRM